MPRENVELADILDKIIHGGGDIIMTTAMRLELKGEIRGFNYEKKSRIKISNF